MKGCCKPWVQKIRCLVLVDILQDVGVLEHAACKPHEGLQRLRMLVSMWLTNGITFLSQVQEEFLGNQRSCVGGWQNAGICGSHWGTAVFLGDVPNGGFPAPCLAGQPLPPSSSNGSWKRIAAAYWNLLPYTQAASTPRSPHSKQLPKPQFLVIASVALKLLEASSCSRHRQAEKTLSSADPVLPTQESPH